jgi:hypothetical protein
MQYYNTNQSHPIIQKNREYILNKKLLSVHSNDRNNDKWKNSNEFEITLPENIKNIESIKLNSISIPNKTPMFSNLFQNIKFKFNILDGPISGYVVELEEGTYTIEQLILSIQNQMNTVSSSTDFICKYNEVTGKLWFGNTSKSFKLLFNEKQEYTITNLNTNLMHDKEYKWGLPAFLGYKKQVYESSSSSTAKQFNHEDIQWLPSPTTSCHFIDIATKYEVNMMDITPYTNIYMEIDKYNSLDEISEYSKHRSINRDKDYNGRVNSAFAKIPFINNSYTLLSKSNSNNSSYHNPPIENISKLKFKFRYHNGLPINLKNTPFSFIIEFNILTNEYHNPSIVRKLF